MISSVYNSTRQLYEIVTDTGQVINDPGLHCVDPVPLCGDYLGFLKCGNAFTFSVVKLSTNQKFDLIVFGSPTNGGGTIVGANDGRYIVMAQRVSQGKNDLPLDLIAVIFDTQTQQYLNFSTLPILQVFRGVGSGQKPQALWIKNGRQVSGFEGTDPIGAVRRISFLQPNIIEFVITQTATNELTNNILRCTRTIDLTNGSLGNIIVETYPFNSSLPLPSWY